MSAAGPETKPSASQHAEARVPDEWVIDQDWASYTPQEHDVWRTLFERQARLLPGLACDEFVQGMRELPITSDRIPDFHEMNQALRKKTGWEVVAVPGLVPDDVFFDHLAHRRFPAGRFIRKPTELDYLEEPDIFHDVFGHVPMLMNPVIANYIQAYGQGGQRAHELGVLHKLARVYWYTVEFGLIQQADGIRVYGAGIASSFTESVFSVGSASPNRVRFNVDRVMRTQYRINDFQETYFVIRNLDELLALADEDFGPIYERSQNQGDLAPGQLLASDDVLARGSGEHHLRCSPKAVRA